MPRQLVDHDDLRGEVVGAAAPAGFVDDLQVSDAADRRALQSAAAVSVSWVADSAALIDAVRAFDLPAGEGCAWCAGEAATTAALRRALVEEKGHDRAAIRAAAYWKRGTSAHHENLEG